MPLIKIVATGGTIANTSHGLIGIVEVLRDIPQARAMADFEVTEATRVRSAPFALGTGSILPAPQQMPLKTRALTASSSPTARLRPKRLRIFCI
jgi:hypothetical protein